MAIAKDAGGPAFPNPQGIVSVDDLCNGMTLRDYFAAQSITAISNTWADPKNVAKHAYEIADAMLEVRAA